MVGGGDGGMVKAVLFDFGNVLYNFDYQRFFDAAARHSDLSADGIREVLFGGADSLAVQFETGRLPSDEFLALLAERARISLPPDGIAEIFTDIYDEHEAHIALVFAVAEHMPVALVSNTNALHYERFMGSTPVVAAMSAVSLSYQVGAMKPAPAMYDTVRKQLSLAPPECVYIDDIREYTDAARSMGFVSIQCLPQTDLRRELADAGVPTHGSR